MPQYKLNMPRITATVTLEQAAWLEKEANGNLSALLRLIIDAYRGKETAE